MAITNDRIREMMKKRLAAKKAAAEETEKALFEQENNVLDEPAKVNVESQSDTEPDVNIDTEKNDEPVTSENQKITSDNDAELNSLLNDIHKKSTVINKGAIEEISNIDDNTVSSTEEIVEDKNDDSNTIIDSVENETVEKNDEETTVVEPTETESTIAEEKPVEKKTRKSRKKKDNAAELKAADAEKKATVQEVAQEIAENIIGTSNQDYTEAIAILTSNYEDDEWIAYKQDIIESMSKIQINADMNPGTLKYALMEINDVEAKLAVRLSEYEAVYTAMIGDYRDGLCNVIRSTNANGSNEETRRQNGFRALAKVNMGGVDLNFIDIITATRIRLKFMQGIQRRLKSMSAICITMSGALKMEKDLLAG